MNLTQLPMYEVAGMIAQRQLSPLELTQACLEQIASRDAEINSFITLTAELALDQARQAEREIQQGAYRGPLHGIPLALKDLFDTAGVRTTAGSLFFADHVPQQDAQVVQRLSHAGAILLGKLNMHEIALGVTNENPHYGVCHNPHDPQRITGGSSGGSAAALAAGFCFGALGSDTGGSIRIPSSLCGVVGLKPTFGRVSLRGVLPLSWNLDHVGPMARTVRDVALLLQVLSGYDAQDPACVEVSVPDFLSDLEQGVSGWRVAMAGDSFFQEADPAVWEAFKTAAQTLTTLGAQVDEVAIPEFRRWAQANGLMVVSDAAAYHRERLAAYPDRFGVDVRQRLQDGVATIATDYILARRAQAEARRWFTQLFHSYDLLLTPATPVIAPHIQKSGSAEKAPQLTRFTAAFNLTGLPALSIPCGFIPSGDHRLPVGLQIVTAPWQETALLRAARAFEQAVNLSPGTVA